MVSAAAGSTVAASGAAAKVGWAAAVERLATAVAAVPAGRGYTASRGRRECRVIGRADAAAAEAVRAVAAARSAA